MARRFALCCVATISALTLGVLCSAIGEHLAPESSPVARGAAYAEPRGCMGCHGSVDDAGPAASGAACPEIDTVTSPAEDPGRWSDVRASFEVVRLRSHFEERVQSGLPHLLAAGESLARQYHCFQCHGYMGQGGFRNPRSLKGYVAGFFGKDFAALTRAGDRESVRSWIVNGVDPRLVEPLLTGSLAALFLRRQEVKMPAFRSLDPAEVDLLVRYVAALNDQGPMTAEALRAYGESFGAPLSAADPSS